MLRIEVLKNIVRIDKSQKEYINFVSQYLIKYEEVRKVDIYHSTKKKKAWKTVKERRDLYTEDSKYIYFSRGILMMIPQSPYYDIVYLNEDEIVVPKINQDEIKNSLDAFQLRDDQVTAVVKSLLCKRGVIQLPTSVGKTAIITSTIKSLIKYNPDIKILALAPQLSTVKNLNDAFLENRLDSSTYNHPDKSLSHQITTAIPVSLVSSQEDLSEVNAVFYDECLPANSKILMPDGALVKIVDIYSDDSIQEVMSYNIKTNEYEIKKILRKFRTPYNNKFWKVYYDNPVTGKTEGVSLTPNHKVFTRDRGFVSAEDLTREDYIKVDFLFARTIKTLTPATFMRVKRVSPNIGSIAEYKYNLEVEDNHNYFASNVLVSNCHHLKCETWNQLNKMLSNVEYSLGFSALSIDKSEIYSKDIREISYPSSLIVGCSGPVIMHMEPSYYINKGIIALPALLRIKHNVKLPVGFDESSWTSLMKEGVMSSDRSYKVAQISAMFNKYSRKSLILVSERSHAFLIGNFLSSLGVTNFGISFGAGSGYLYSSVDENCNVKYDDISSFEVLDMLKRGDINIVIGTQHVDEGVDISKLDCIVLAGGGKKDRRIIQRVGRVLRKSKTGKYAYIVDFTDEGSRVLSRQSRERLRMYKDFIGIPKENIFDGISIDNLERKFVEMEGLV